MSSVDRRDFVQLTGAAVSVPAHSIARAASIPANRRTGSIRDVEHIVVLMQENRYPGDWHRDDLVPFHHALADAFTICDAYHCSLFDAADPDVNTYLERLEAAGVSGKIYPDGGDGLTADVMSGRLSQISWIVVPEARTAWYVADVLDALTADPDVWSRTALFLTFDEVPGPYGRGVRVPMIVVSPWTTGGFVDSEVFDRTSIIRFMERRFGVREPDISPWQRAVCGDLTSAFDFGRARPVVPSRPGPEHGVRPARALSYDLVADGRTDGTNLRVYFASRGRNGAVFSVTSSAGDPRSYPIGAGHHLSGTWSLSETVTVHGPNGFRREFRSGGVDVIARHEHGGDVELTLANHGSHAVRLTLSDGYRRGHADVLRLRPGQRALRSHPSGRNHGWYDVTITSDTDRTYLRRLAGHVETGRPSTSDPARA
jgi:phospholipase C